MESAFQQRGDRYTVSSHDRMLEGDKCFGQKEEKADEVSQAGGGSCNVVHRVSAEETAGTNAPGLEQAWNVEGAARRPVEWSGPEGGRGGKVGTGMGRETRRYSF